MKNLPVSLLILVSLGLCVVCVAQWRRESAFRQKIVEANATLQAEAEARNALEDKVAAYEQEITRLAQLRADTEAKLVEITDELTGMQSKIAESGQAAMERAREVEAQNAAITEANTRLQQVTAERDHAIEELNKRTRAYNELMARQSQGAR
jgi:chromosome segregation ATPase